MLLTSCGEGRASMQETRGQRGTGKDLFAPFHLSKTHPCCAWDRGLALVQDLRDEGEAREGEDGGKWEQMVYQLFMPSLLTVSLCACACVCVCTAKAAHRGSEPATIATLLSPPQPPPTPPHPPSIFSTRVTLACPSGIERITRTK